MEIQLSFVNPNKIAERLPGPSGRTNHNKRPVIVVVINAINMAISNYKLDFVFPNKRNYLLNKYLIILIDL
jgi:hypothetical protein